MRNRIAAVGGTLEVDSATARGMREHGLVLNPGWRQPLLDVRAARMSSSEDEEKRQTLGAPWMGGASEAIDRS